MPHDIRDMLNSDFKKTSRCWRLKQACAFAAEDSPNAITTGNRRRAIITRSLHLLWR